MKKTYRRYFSSTPERLEYHITVFSLYSIDSELNLQFVSCMSTIFLYTSQLLQLKCWVEFGQVKEICWGDANSGVTQVQLYRYVTNVKAHFIETIINIFMLTMHHYVCMYVKGLPLMKKRWTENFQLTPWFHFFSLLLFSFPASDFTFYFKFLCCWQRNGCKGTWKVCAKLIF